MCIRWHLVLVATALRVEPSVQDSRPDVPPVDGETEPDGRPIRMKTAVSIMTDVLWKLSLDKEKAEIKKRREGLAPDASMQECKTHMMPLLNKLLRDLAYAKYGFKGGFQQAMVSVEQAARRKYHKELRRQLALLQGILKPDPSLDVLVSSLVEIANTFLDMGEAERGEAVAKTKQILEGMKVDGQYTINGIGYYADVMTGVTSERGTTFVEESMLDLLEVRRSDLLKEHEELIAQKRINILNEFLREEDYDSLQERLRNAEQAHLEGEDGEAEDEDEGAEEQAGDEEL